MSQFNVNEIRAADNSLTTEVEIPSLKKNMAQALANFNGQSTGVIRHSVNISSVTDNGVGNYLPQLIRPIDSDAAVIATHSAIGANDNGVNGNMNSSTQALIRTYAGGNTIDPSAVSFAVFGELL